MLSGLCVAAIIFACFSSAFYHVNHSFPQSAPVGFRGHGRLRVPARRPPAGRPPWRSWSGGGVDGAVRRRRVSRLRDPRAGSALASGRSASLREGERASPGTHLPRAAASSSTARPRAAGFEWTDELCRADTDGDGEPNGHELGDPCACGNGETPMDNGGVSPRHFVHQHNL